jgi:HlyD family secretion protein
MTKRTKWIIGGSSVAVAIALVFGLTRSDGVEVEVAVVTRDTLSVTVSDEGRTRARERYVVAAPITGRLSRAVVEEGDAVEEGDLLTTLSPPPQDSRVLASLRAELSSAQARAGAAAADVTTARAHEEQARREVDRRRPLLEMGAISREAMERHQQAALEAAARREAAEAGLRAAESGVREVRSRLVGVDVEAAGGQPVSVRAPVSGRVLRVLEDSDRVVGAGTPLVVIADVGGLEVVVDLPTEEAVRVEPGNPLRVSGWGGEQILTGRVRRVEPSAFTEISALGVEEQRVDVVGDLEAAPQTLGDGFRLQVAVVVWQGDDVLTVPGSALFQQSGGWRVFAIEEGRARLRSVRIGHRGTDRAEVLEGLAEGDRVVSYPSDLVGEGVRIRASGN